MNKRSAVAVAGGVAGALISGLAGYSVRVQHQPATPQAAPGKPVVKKQVRTITIHKKAKPPALAAQVPVQTVVVHRAPTIVPATRAAPVAAPVHHTGASPTAGGGEREDEHEHEFEGSEDGGEDD